LADFKLKLAASLSEGVPFIHRNVSVNDGAAQVLVKVVDNTVAALLKYRNDASSANIEKAVDAILEAHQHQRKLEFFGVGNSGIVAQDAQHKFFRLGFHTNALSDGHMQIMSASLLKAGDVLVVISSSGRTRDLLDSCEIARKNGATTIVITASGSALSQVGSIHLAADHPENYERFSPMVSRLLHLMIVDILATRTALRIGSDELAPTLRSMKHNLLKKRYS
jgi:RpiR family carbohydrate utilization transcriptional regulator